jgi:RNA polymerase sigma-70 factor (ECF subfamily)
MTLSSFYHQAVPGRAATFATTHWRDVLAAGRDDCDKAREALEQLCAVYWYPLYAFARRQGYDATESEDPIVVGQPQRSYRVVQTNCVPAL